MIWGPFANNWWTRRWLETLLFNALDRDLELGLRYATKDQVVKLDVIDNRVIADVLGPNGGHHNCYLVFPKFAKEHSDFFVEILKRQPAELMALSNDSLNTSIELILSKCGLEIFDAFEKVKVECDCKDLEPSRYTVAVLMKLAQMMDSNPCVLFKLHGLELEHLKEEKAKAVSVDVPRESGLFRLKPDSETEIFENDLPFPEFKFLSWTDYSKILPTLLAPNPKFCAAGNFKKSFCEEIDRVHEKFAGYFSFGAFAEDYHCNFAKASFDETQAISLSHLLGWNWGFEFSGERVSASRMISALCALDESCFERWHRSVQFLYTSLKVAFYLVRTCAIYPQVFWLNENTAQVRWLAADMLPEILSVVALLDSVAPDKIVTTEEHAIYEQTEHLLSVCINELLTFVRKTRTSTKKSMHENLLAFFFECRSGKLNNVQIPLKIQEWFSVYNSLDFKTEIYFVATESGDDIAVDVFVQTASETTSREPLSKLFQANDSRLLSVLNVLSSVAENFIQLKDYIESKATSSIVLRGQDLLVFLKETLAKIQMLGLKVELPKSLMEIKKPRSRISVSGGSFGSFSAEDILDFDWEVAVGDEKISAKEFLKLAEAADGLLKLKSNYVEVSEEDIEKIRKKMEEGVDNGKLVQACLTGEYKEDDETEIVPITLSQELKSTIESLRDSKEEDLPEGLNATLRPYQERGYSWLCNKMRLGFGCILADDMGLGKTLQVITFLLKLKNDFKLEERKALVVVPAALLFNWQAEVKKFAPSLSVFLYHGGLRDLLKFKQDVLITTYGTYRRDYEKINTLEWQVIVIDEAQNIKNFDTAQSKLLRSMRAPMKIAMSGTPVENRLLEYWTIMDFCNHGLLGSMAEFHTEFEVPIQKNNDEAAAERFKRVTAPFMLRRLKTDKNIISDLPDKIIQDEFVELTKSQAVLYKKTLEHFMTELEAVKLFEENDPHALFKRKGIVLQMILALKQICNHPKTFFKRDMLELFCENQNAEQVSVAKESGKVQMLLELLTEIQNSNEKTLIFTQFAEMGELLKQIIVDEIGIETEFYHGGLSQTQRKKIVEDFQNNDDKKILILSLKAGGTGLNLTAASQVIHYDLWWNPAIEAQATDRAFRIGQKRNVQVHRFITKGTFEEKINALLESKKAIANLTVNVGESWLTDLNEKELGEIFKLDL